MSIKFGIPSLFPGRNRSKTIPSAAELPLRDSLWRLHEPLWMTRADGGRWRAVPAESIGEGDRFAFAPACGPDDLGDPQFKTDHQIRCALVSGAMANGIASVALVQTMARSGMMGYFGSAGLSFEKVAVAVAELKATLSGKTFGCNLIHSPNEPALEAAVADLYLKEQVRFVEASAFLGLTLPIVKYRTAGIRRDPTGKVIVPNRVMAKVSRVEVAARFLAPPPDKFLQALVAAGDLTTDQADLARKIPLCDDLTAEADSGGHTDNRPAIALLPTMIALRDRLRTEHGYDRHIRVGLAGGIATPASAAAAFAMGAGYVVTGSINQACVESGSSDRVRDMLAAAQQADTAMAPAADMFEMGVKVQVLKRGTMFPMRAAKLYELYRTYPSLDAIPAAERTALEKNILMMSIDEVWSQTRSFFERRDPQQIERADADPKHKMALVFRWYLGQSSRWANAGADGRQVDYQIWCGPSMGAFNEWVAGTFLSDPKQRSAAVVNGNLMLGAAWRTRMQILALQGVTLSADEEAFRPLPLVELRRHLSWMGELA